ncbi:hypothetical protein TNCV_4287871 [Trichonephila clavipes]|uniref:Uncharacterized protein n=1 Tax=Trichonephila clavipes TaxID=2585209 RepID=A0A8X6SG85_TRICX|nr:hypothetical protein TNCV_4287871 [Trichonephila clavipes]
MSDQVHEQMFRSGGQPEAKPPAFSFQASLVLVYQLTEKMKGRADLAQAGDRTLDFWCGSSIRHHSAAGRHNIELLREIITNGSSRKLVDGAVSVELEVRVLLTLKAPYRAADTPSIVRVLWFLRQFV